MAKTIKEPERDSAPAVRRKAGTKAKGRGRPFALGNTAGSEYRFKSGRSGNPAGGPKRKPVTDAYLAFFENHAEELAAIVRAMVKQAKKGNVRAIVEITDRLEGKAPIDVRLDLGEQLVQRIAQGYRRVQEARTA